MGNTFLNNHPDLETQLINFIGNDKVVVSKTDWEKTQSSISFGRVKVVNDELLPNVDFLYDKETEFEWEGKPMKIVGRVDWVGYHPDYILVPATNKKHDLSNNVQVSEEKLVEHFKKIRK